MSFGRHGFCNTADINTHSIAPRYFEPTRSFRFIYQDNGFSCGPKVKMNDNLGEKMKGVLTSFFFCDNDSCFVVILTVKRSLKLIIILKSSIWQVNFEPELNLTRLFNPGYVVICMFSNLITQNGFTISSRYKKLIFLQISMINKLTEL